MVKRITKASLLGLTKHTIGRNFRSDRLFKKRQKCIRSYTKIQKKYKKYLRHRYSFLQNNHSNDLITLEEICLIPKPDLYRTVVNGRLFGIRSSSYLRWLMEASFFDLPKNIFTNDKMTICDFLLVLNNAIKASKNPYYKSMIEKDELIQYIDKGKKKLSMLLNPCRYITLLNRDLRNIIWKFVQYYLIVIIFFIVHVVTVYTQFYV